MRYRVKLLPSLGGLLVVAAFAVLSSTGPLAGLSGNNMWNFENWCCHAHSADDSHDGWTNAGGWSCDGKLHESLEGGWVPNGEHDCDTSPD